MDPLEIGELLSVLAKRFNKEDAPSKLYKSTTINLI